MSNSHLHLKTGGRYPVLRALGILYVAGAVGAFCYGLYWIGWSLFAAPAGMGERLQLVLMALAATFFGVITILAVAELIKLAIDVERNTRLAAMNAVGSAAPAGGDGASAGGPTAANRITALDEESAEAALIRGH